MNHPAPDAPPRAPEGPTRLIPHLWSYFRRPLACYRDLLARYGDPFSVPFPLGGRMAVTGCPAHIRQIFAAPAADYRLVDDDAGNFYGSRSLTVLDCDEHGRMRRLLDAPLLHRRGLSAAAIRDASLEQVSRQPAGAPFPMMDLARAITLDTILRTVFGVLDGPTLEAFRRAIGDLHGTVGFWTVFVKAARRDLGPWSPWGRFLRARARCYGLIDEQILRLRSGGDDGQASVLAHWLARREPAGEPALADEDIRENLLTLLFAGHDSTAAALTWVFYWVHREPGVLARLMTELEGYGAGMDVRRLADTPYLDAVCQESLRFHPIAPGVARRLGRPMGLGSCTVDEGDVVLASIDLVSHDPTLYEAPERFLPERFLGRDYGRDVFIPFGGGHRRCPGATLAFEELRVVTATLVAGYRFRLLSLESVQPRWSHGIRTPGNQVRLVLEGPRS